jgi:hypothetical protein
MVVAFIQTDDKYLPHKELALPIRYADYKEGSRRMGPWSTGQASKTAARNYCNTPIKRGLSLPGIKGLTTVINVITTSYSSLTGIGSTGLILAPLENSPVLRDSLPRGCNAGKTDAPGKGNP